MLTPRERQVTGLVALGHTNADVARLLGIHHKTVETHRKRVMTKLGLRKRAELVRFAMSQGLVASNPGDAVFQHCSRCSVLWSLRSQFLSDREVRFLGYKPAAVENAPGSLTFRHRSCGADLSVALESFAELAGGPLLSSSCAEDEMARKFCLAKANGQPCPLRCVCAFAWRASRIIRRWPKS